MKCILAFVALLCLTAGLARAQNITAASTDCSASGSCVRLNLPTGTSTVGVNLSGTFVGTFQFEGAIKEDGTVVAVNCRPMPSAATVTSATAVGTWTCSVGGLGHFRVRSSAYTSGPAVVALRADPGTRSSASPLAVEDGGTGLSGGTSGGILGFTGPATLASSVELTANALIAGGGAGATPTPLALGAPSAILGMNGGGTANEYRSTVGSAQGGFGASLAAAATGTYAKSNGASPAVFAASTLAASGVGTPAACTNQFVTGFTLAGDAAPTSTCATATLASAQFANQGTTTTVLHGNAGGNPAFGAVVLADTTGIAGSGANADITSLTPPLGIGTAARTGNTTPGQWLDVFGGNIEVADPATLGTESLTAPADFSNGAWAAAAEFAVVGTFARYTFAATGAGTVTQAAPAVAGVANRWYKLVYVISAAPTQLGGTLTVTTAFAATAQTLPITAGSNTVYFKSAAVPGAFVMSVTGVSSGSFTIESASLKEVQGGNVIAAGKFTGGGSGGIKIKSNNYVYLDAGLEIGAGTNISDSYPYVFGFGTYYNGAALRSASMFKFSSGTSASHAWDTALGRNAAGVVEINSGTAGTYRDLIARNVTSNGGTFSGSLTGNADTATALSATLTEARFPALDGDVTTVAGDLTTAVKSNLKISSFGATFDNSTTVVPVGTRTYVRVPWAGTIVGWSIVACADAGLGCVGGGATTATIDVWKVATGTSLPADANTITASAVPALATGNALKSTTLTGWTVAVAADDIVGFNVDAAAVATWLSITIYCTRS